MATMKSLTEMKRWATLRCERCGHRAWRVFRDLDKKREAVESLPNHCERCGAWGTSEVHLTGCANKETT
jgi:hypothetical protein